MQTPPHLRGRFSFSLFFGRQANEDGVRSRCYFLAPGVRSVLAQPVVDLSVRLGLVIAIPLLQDTGKLLRLATQFQEIVVSEFAPLLSHLALEFFPLAEQNVIGCVHVNSSLSYLQPVVGRLPIPRTVLPVDGVSSCLSCMSHAIHCHALSTLSVSYTHLRAHETVLDLVCRLLLEKKNNIIQ